MSTQLLDKPEAEKARFVLIPRSEQFEPINPFTLVEDTDEERRSREFFERLNADREKSSI